MTQITLTSDQSQVFANATDVVTFCDASGNVLVRIQATVSDEEAVIIAEAKRRLASDRAAEFRLGRFSTTQISTSTIKPSNESLYGRLVLLRRKIT